MYRKILFAASLVMGFAASVSGQVYMRIDQNNVPGVVTVDSLIKPVMFNATAIGLTANGTVSIPKAKTILQVVVQNTGSAAMIGGLKIGTASGAADVVSALAIPANSLFSITDSQLLKRVFSMGSDQLLYLQAGTGWNGAKLNVYIVLKSLN